MAASSRVGRFFTFRKRAIERGIGFVITMLWLQLLSSYVWSKDVAGERLALSEWRKT